MVMEIKARGGKKPKLARLDGEIVEIKKVSRFGSSDAIFIPKAWVMALKIRYGKEPTHYALTYNATALIIKPYFEEES